MREVVLEFGINAGKVWRALDSRGSLTKNQLMKHTNIKTDEFHGAVGWLAKENKIRKDGEFYQLDETNLKIKIEEDAEKIWDLIDKRKCSMSNLSKITHMDEKDVQIALGWLAREGKLDRTDDKSDIDSISSEKHEISDLNEEIKALKSDLETRNMIIKEITEQLTNKQTQFIKNVDVVDKQKLELDQMKNKLIANTSEASSAQLEISNLKEEIAGLNTDLATRNEIIKEITEQLTDRQTQFIESSETIENLRGEINLNKNKMKLMSEKLNERLNNVTELQKELEKDHTPIKQTESKLFNNDQPLIQPDRQSVEWDEFESIEEEDPFGIINKTNKSQENILKNKKVEIDE
jgi:chromosome segregation ATPase